MIEGSAAAPGDRDLSRLSVRTLPDGAGLAVWRSEDRAKVFGRPGGGEGAAVACRASGEDVRLSRLVRRHKSAARKSGANPHCITLTA